MCSNDHAAPRSRFSNALLSPATSDHDADSSFTSSLYLTTSNDRESSESALNSESTRDSSLSIIVDDHDDNMDPPLPPAREDASVLMAQVLDRMDRIVEHFRAKGETDAANAMAKNIITIVTTFNNTTIEWDLETALIAAPVTSNSTQALSAPEGSQPKTGKAETKQNNPSTWAAVAAVAPALKNSLVKQMSRTVYPHRYMENEPPTNGMDDDLRVVWVCGWKKDRPLGDVTQKVGHGPIYSIAYSAKDGSVCIIFQFASSAKALMDDEQDYVKLHGKSKFGEKCTLSMGLAFPCNEDLLRMISPHNERRRLTFARQQLFSHGTTEAKFKADIYSIVGEGNVELVWMFNTGNATVVFSAVSLARLVRDEFVKSSRQYNSPYRDVHITFSHDPCERPMSLVKQMPAGRDLREGTYGGDSKLPADLSNKDSHSPPGRRIGRDSDGWQTVARKR